MVNLQTTSLGLRHSGIPYLLSIVGTDLKTVGLYWEGIDDPNEPLGTVPASLDILSSYHQLRELQLHGDSGPEDEATVALSQALLCSRPNLTRFDCDNIFLSMEDIVYLASSPTLLDVHMRFPENLHWSSFRTVGKPFPTIRSLSLACSVESYAAFALLVPTMRTLKFSIHITTLPISNTFSVLFTSIRHQFDLSRLSTLIIVPDSIDDDADVAQYALEFEVLVTPDHLRPLLEFTQLREVNISPPWGFALDNDFFRDIAKAWIHLLDLRLAHARWCLHAPLATTLLALSYFAAYCPDLKTLAIRFDAEAWTDDLTEQELWRPKITDSYYGVLRGKPSMSKLNTLWINRFPIAQPEQVALYIHRLFPELQPWCERGTSTAANSGDERRWNKAWSEVQRYLEAMAEIKEEEKA